MEMCNRRSLRYLFLLIISDAKRYEGKLWKQRGFLTSLAYRVRRARKYGNWQCRLFLLPVDVLTGLIGMLASDAEIPSVTRIGSGLYLPHPQGVIIGSGSYVGSNVSIFQQVTIGAWNDREPVVKSHASIFAGAKLIGGCVVKRHAFVAANCVVVKDVPEWHVAVGVPAVNRLRSDCDARLAQKDSAKLKVLVPSI